MNILMFGERKGVRGERPLFAARCDRMAARKAVPVTTQEATPVGSRAKGDLLSI